MPTTSVELRIAAEQVPAQFRELLISASDEMRRMEWLIREMTGALNRIAEDGRLVAHAAADGARSGNVVQIKRPARRLWDEGGDAA